jgi:hypothetical protein
MSDEPLPVEVRLDPDAPAGDFTVPLAALLLRQARRRLAERNPPGKEETISDVSDA